MSSHDLRAALRVRHEHTCLEYGAEPKTLDPDPPEVHILVQRRDGLYCRTIVNTLLEFTAREIIAVSATPDIDCVLTSFSYDDITLFHQTSRSTAVFDACDDVTTVMILDN